MDESIICRNIKRLRKKNRLTLAQLADLTGLTKGYLSRVERSEKAPPYSTLNKIARAMDVEVTQLFEENGPLEDIRISIQRKNEGVIIKGTSRRSGYDYKVLAGDKPGKNMEPFIIYSPREINKMYTHEGEELIYVLEGTLEFIFGEQTYILEEGDHVYFDSRVPHAGRSIGDEIAKLFVVIYFYKRNRR